MPDTVDKDGLNEEQLIQESNEEQIEVTEQYMTRNSKLSRLIFVIVAVLVLGLLALLFTIMNDRNNLKKEVTKLSQSQVSAADEAKELNTEVAKLIELPSDEVPSIATVADEAKLKQQSPGFDNAKTGDKLLIYTRSKQIVVYRPSTKKVVAIVQINIGQTDTTQQGSKKNQ